MANDFLARMFILFVTLTTASLGTSYVQMAQVGAAAATSGGKCQQAYQQCMHQAGGLSDPNAGAKKCESTWQTCVKNKCVAKDTASAQQCPKDPDCESSCMEAVSSKDGLQSCCLGTPKHTQDCRKYVDGICNPGTPSERPFELGPGYKEGDIIPPSRPSPTGDDPAMVLNPSSPLSAPKYPEGTTFSENGLPSNAPSTNPTDNMKEVKPDWNFSIQQYAQQLGYQNLPSEYQPAMPYTPSVTDAQFPRNQVTLDGVTYSAPAPVYTNQDGTLSAFSPSGAEPYVPSGVTNLRNPSPVNDYSSGSTFPEPVSSGSNITPISNSCHFNVFGWCVW
jgi:hypothetical protein